MTAMLSVAIVLPVPVTTIALMVWASVGVIALMVTAVVLLIAITLSLRISRGPPVSIVSVVASRHTESWKKVMRGGKKRIVRKQRILKSIHCSLHTMASAWEWTKTRNSANRRCALFPHEASASSGQALRSDPILHIFCPVSLPSRKGPPAVVQATRVASQGREGKRSTGPCSALLPSPRFGHYSPAP